MLEGRCMDLETSKRYNDVVTTSMERCVPAGMAQRLIPCILFRTSTPSLSQEVEKAQVDVSNL